MGNESPLISPTSPALAPIPMGPPPLPSEVNNENGARRPCGQKTWHSSLTPPMRREHQVLRSSPLTGPSFAADGAGNVVEHTSVLEEEIARRRTMLLGLSDEELARFAASSPTSPTLALSHSSSPNPSRRGSLETTEEPQTPRRARPSFISLDTQGSHSGDRNSLAPPTLTPPVLRARHSSPQLLILTKPKPPESGSASWMTAVPAPTFSRMGVHGSNVVLPTKASSREGQRIRLKSMPNRSVSAAAKLDTRPQPPAKPRSLKSFHSMSRILRKSNKAEHENIVPPMPTSISSSCPRQPPSSSESEARGMPTPPNDSINAQMVPAILDPDAESLRFLGGGGVLGITGNHDKLEKEGENRVKRLWTKVRKWRPQP